jgi:hypothetical protein
MYEAIQPMKEPSVLSAQRIEGVVCSTSRSCNVWDNAATENFFSANENRAHRTL